MELPNEIEFSVTQRHIDLGKPLAACHCPIALSLKELFPDSCVRVAATNASIGGRAIDGPSAVYGLPTDAQEFAVNFDLCNPVEPSVFTIQRINE